MHNEELYNFKFPSNFVRTIKLREMRWAGHVALMGEKTNIYSILLRKTEEKGLLGNPRHRCENSMS